MRAFEQLRFSRFEKLVSEYAGANNPLVELLDERNSFRYLLKEAEFQIKLAWQTGIFSGLLTLIFLLFLLGHKGITLIDSWLLIDAILFFGLSFGIYKKSRVAAVTLLTYFLFNQALLIIELKQFPGVISLFLGAICIGGVQGTFNYQKLSRTGKDLGGRLTK